MKSDFPVIKILVLALVYFAAGKFGLSFQPVSGFATLVWPPTGIAIAALLIWGLKLWPAILIGAFFVNLNTGATFFVALGIGLGNMFEAVLATYLLKKLRFENLLKKLRDVLLLIFIAGFFSTLVSATVGTTVLLLGNIVSIPAYFKTWSAWWLGDVLGALIIAPLILVWSKIKISTVKFTKIFEIAALVLVTLFVNLLVFGGIAPGLENYPITYIVFPTLIWAALRFGVKGAVSITFLAAMLAIWGTAKGEGFFIQANLSESLFSLQMFMAIVSSTVMILAASLEERKKAEADLKKANIELQDDFMEIELQNLQNEAILDSIGEGIIVTNEKGKIYILNRQAEDMLGLKAGQAIGKQISELISMEDGENKVLAEKDYPLTQAFATGKTITASHMLVRKDKTKLPAAIIATPLILDGKTIGAVKVFHDETKERQIDRAKTEFVSLASHQLRTPLTAIKWNSSRLLNSWDQGTMSRDEQKKYVQDLYSTSMRMVELVNAILNVSKVDLGTLAIEPEPGRVEKVMENVIEELHLEILKKHLKIVKNYDANLPLVEFDHKLMRIVFQNLLSNAAKYTPTNGHITCEIHKENNTVLIAVADTGYGIPKADFSKVFTKFFRTETARSLDPNGNGLGLYITKAVIEATEGKIWFESEEGKGTTFYVVIPSTGVKPKEGVKGLVES